VCLAFVPDGVQRRGRAGGRPASPFADLRLSDRESYGVYVDASPVLAESTEDDDHCVRLLSSTGGPGCCGCGDDGGGSVGAAAAALSSAESVTDDGRVGEVATEAMKRRRHLRGLRVRLQSHYAGTSAAPLRAVHFSPQGLARASACGCS